MKRYLLALTRSFSTTGLIVGTLFFCLSLTPSLMPRSPLIQGALSGSCAAFGYAIGVFLVWLWAYLEILPSRVGFGRTWQVVAAVFCIGIATLFLWQASSWQNSVRDLMGLDPVTSADPVKLIAVALAVFCALVVVGRLFKYTFLFSYKWLQRFVPRRIAIAVGTFLAIILFWSVAEGVLFRAGLRMADTSFRELDALIDDDMPMPTDPAKTGSAASLIDWRQLGRQGRHFISSGPTGDEIGGFLNTKATEPIRVYVGLNSAETAEERAKLALAELKRDGAFDRSILIVIVPTGTGWVDPAAIDTVEYLNRGDVASVALQYSYLASWLSLMVEPGYGADAAHALFREVYGYWTTLPHDHRPRLYLHGLSLGAMNSQLSANLYDVIADPFQGALWSGPPFPSGTWAFVTANRNPGSPAWLPRFRDGSIIRFTNQENALNIPGAAWGPIRIVFLQYASDAVTFFDVRSFYRMPDWLKSPRGPDVSPSLRWFPVVTMLQLAFDAMIATTSPMGYGHVYAPEHYIDAWLAVTDPTGWQPAEINRLKSVFAQRFRETGQN
ncbi:alpha/beta-hydrolase family protein [Rhizobium sp. P32RR-XVIII]|uniref:alpha/beta hydrolase n=1 Tax=Rhizobium sp. P32RR-XVIII TaxID=2726738 RepID=UPI001FED9BF2|nr:alpha/beta-hydrolase family protein [Rhizobium sp. P32RR-XVIII]